MVLERSNIVLNCNEGGWGMCEEEKVGV
ncbi:hypothetical protein A2U01_0088619, partial [Trifolium medium]|nr:hypothetical protein [Trifolium medium]